MHESTEFRHFVLQGLDPSTETVSVEARISISDIGELRRIIGPDADEDPDLDWQYELSRDEMKAVGAICRRAFVPDEVFTEIAPWTSIRDVPYLIHTNFELPLMLEGRKPLASFGDGYPSQWFEDYLAPFDPFVRSGQLIRRVIDHPMPHIKQRRPDLDGIRDVYFALPGEEWRIDAHILLMKVGQKSEWNDSLERYQGSLLGYEDWQNDWWIEQRQKRRTENEPITP
jgi:hypothetical protein